MAIRFQCSGCSQPIEIDDEWALKAVACPYCRRTITAPVESTLGDAAQIPTAVPLPGGANVSGPTRQIGIVGGADAAVPHPEPTQNRAAVASFVLACLMAGMVIALLVVSFTHADEVAAFARTLEGGGGFQEMMNASQKLLEEQGGFPGWMIAATVLELGIGALWIAAVICGVIGLRCECRRALAILSLAGCAGLAILLCANVFLALL